MLLVVGLAGERQLEHAAVLVDDLARLALPEDPFAGLLVGLQLDEISHLELARPVERRLDLELGRTLLGPEPLDHAQLADVHAQPDLLRRDAGKGDLDPLVGCSVHRLAL